MPNKWTFELPPVADLLARYVGDGKNWIDPFAGMYSPAEITNDINMAMPTMYHMKAESFLRSLGRYCGKLYDGVLFDPPYNLSQLKQCYGNIGAAVTSAEAKHFPHIERLLAAKLIKDNGLVISFGWNSQGIGKKHGFKIIEILLVSHGRSHNDTICTVERKVQKAIW